MGYDDKEIRQSATAINKELDDEATRDVFHKFAEGIEKTLDVDLSPVHHFLNTEDAEERAEMAKETYKEANTQYEQADVSGWLSDMFASFTEGPKNTGSERKGERP